MPSEALPQCVRINRAKYRSAARLAVYLEAAVDYLHIMGQSNVAVSIGRDEAPVVVHTLKVLEGRRHGKRPHKLLNDGIYALLRGGRAVALVQVRELPLRLLRSLPGHNGRHRAQRW